MITSADANLRVSYIIEPVAVQTHIDSSTTTPAFATEVALEFYSDGDDEMYVYGLPPVKDGSRPDKRRQKQMLVLNDTDDAALLASLGIDRDAIRTALGAALPMMQPQARGEVR